MSACVALLMNSRTLRQLLRQAIIEALGLEVHLFESAQQAQAAFAAAPEAYLAAVVNPTFGEGSDPIADSLAARVPCIVLTASFSEALRQEVYDRGVTDYVINDASFAENVVRVLRWLRDGFQAEILVVDDS